MAIWNGETVERIETQGHYAVTARRLCSAHGLRFAQRLDEAVRPEATAHREVPAYLSGSFTGDALVDEIAARHGLRVVGVSEVATWTEAWPAEVVAVVDDRPAVRIARFAAIGDDGRRPVVWGVGDSEEAARDDATENVRHAVPKPWRTIDALRIVSISEERYHVIAAGDVDAADL